MRRACLVILMVFFLSWALEALWLSPSPPGDWAWWMRQEGMLLTGIMALGAMSAIMVLALRPRGIELWLGGMDKAYGIHKWLGIVAIGLSIAHWAAKESKGWIAAAWGTAARLAKLPMADWAMPLKPYAKTLGEWTLYALVVMLLITLAQKMVSYRRWYWWHKAMPVAYLALVFHGVVLTPQGYWSGLGGWLLALSMLIGSAAALVQLVRDMRNTYPYTGTVTQSTLQAGVLHVQCQMDARWPGHQAGQFVFLRLPHTYEAHPFTLSDSGASTSQVSFHIKCLGDWTAALPQRLTVGQTIELDGPYGCFTHPDHDDGAVHIWIGAGVGATPFLAWLGQSHSAGHAPQARMQYLCKHGTDPLAQELQRLAQQHPDVDVDIFADGLRWQPGAVLKHYQPGKPLHVWLCGPASMGKALRRALQAQLPHGSWQLHQEHFQLR